MLLCELFLISVFAVVACLAAPLNASTTEYNSTTNLTSTLPVIDLGYARYRASKYDKDADFYLFSNIRYAAPPVGSRRFQLPQPPVIEEDINDGKTGYMCMQATNIQFKWLDFIPNPTKQSEDCLFLDVVVPGHVVRSKMLELNHTAGADGATETTGLPVMAWIHGGGFAFGEKGGIYNPKGLMKAAGGRMIYVAFNYRLGAFGFLAGKAVRAKAATNAGLHDQRMALDWVHQHISKFGGDASAITVIGESAGASSVMHHLTSPEPVQFKRAIMQSTAYYPQYDNDILESQYSRFATLSGCGNVEDTFNCLVCQDRAILAKANKDAVFSSMYGTFEFGPYVDRTYVPLLPLFRFGYGHYNRGVELLVGYNSDEGFMFADPSIVKTEQFNKLLRKNFANASDDTIDEIKALYPKEDYDKVFRRIAAVISEWVVECNSIYLDDSYPGTYLYRFSIPPGIHSQDLFLTFWGGLPSFDASAESHLQTSGISVGDIATSFQSYLVSFVVSGNPNKFRTTEGKAPTVHFPKSHDWAGRPMVDVGKDGFSYLSLDSDGPDCDRCAFWMEGDWTGR